MNFIKLAVLLSYLLIVLNSCGFGEAGKVLRNEKKKSTDEFLVKKRGSLSQPPDFEKIPEPKSKNEIKKSDQSNIERILKINKPTSSTSQNKSSSTEESILKQIKK